MSGLLGNDKKKEEGGLAEGATGVAKTGTGSEFFLTPFRRSSLLSVTDCSHSSRQHLVWSD